MASLSGFLPISLFGTQVSASGVSIPLRRLQVELAFACRRGTPVFRRCLLDSRAAVSVVPLGIQQTFALTWQPLAGPWPAGLTNWMGVACEVGWIDVRHAIPQAPHLRGPFRLIAKFPQAAPAHLPGNVPILLGLNFLTDYLATIEFQCYQFPQAGTIVLP